MNKKTVIIIVLFVLVATVITLSVLGVIAPQESAQGSFLGWQDAYRGIPSMP